MQIKIAHHAGTVTADAKPGDFIKVNILGHVMAVSPHFMSAGPADVYQVQPDGTAKRLHWA